MKELIILATCLLTINTCFSHNTSDSSKVVSLKPDEIILDSSGNASKFCWRTEDQVDVIIESIIKAESLDTLEGIYTTNKKALDQCRVSSNILLLKVDNLESSNEENDKIIESSNFIISEQKKVIRKLKWVKIPLTGFLGVVVGFGISSFVKP